MFPDFLRRRWIAILSGTVLFIVIFFMPQPEGMNEASQRMLAVTGLMAVWWMGEAVPIPVTALLPLALFPFFGIMPGKEVAPHFTNHLIFLFLGGFIIGLAMEKWHLHRRVALTVIAAMGVSPVRIIFGFMLATALLSMWISNTAAAVMMLPIAIAVVKQTAVGASYEGKKGPDAEVKIQSNFGLVLMLGIAYSASIGGVGTLIGTPPNIVFAGFYKKLFPYLPEIGFFQWMFWALPLVMVFLPLVWWYLCQFVSNISLGSVVFFEGGSSVIKEELRSLGKMNHGEKFVSCIFMVTAFLWIFRQPVSLGFFTLPGWSGLFENPKFLQDSTVAIFMALLLFLMPLNFKEGVLHEGHREYFVMDWKTVEKGVPWGILLLFGGGFALAAGFRKTGLDFWLGSQLSALEAWPVGLTVLIICLSITFLTELTSNTATTTMILPVLGAAAATSNINPLLLMVPATLSASFAFMLPIATPPNAILFSSGWITIPQMVRAGLALNLAGACFITILTLILL